MTQDLHNVSDEIRERGDSIASSVGENAFAKAVRAISERRSIRRYLPQRIDVATILTLLAVAVTAPSAHNRQPWRFRVLLTHREKSALAGSMGDKLRADRLADGDAPDVVEADVQRSRLRIVEAPAVVVVCTSMVDMDTYPDKTRSDTERLMAVMGTAMAVQNFLIAAHAAGLGACWMCAPLFCPEVVSDTLRLPVDWEPTAIITVGYPADEGKPRTRRPQSDVVKMTCMAPPEDSGNSIGL